MRHTRGGLNLGICRFRLCKTDILAHGGGLEPGILQHHTVLAAQAFPRDGADLAAIDANGAGLHVVKAHEQVDERRLSAARRADDGDALAGFYGEVQVLNQMLLRRVGECDVLEFHAAGDGFERLCIRGVRRFNRFVDQFKYPRGAGQCILQFRNDAGDLVEGLGILVRVAEETRQPADRDRPCHGAERAGKADAGIDDVVNDARRRVRHGREEGCAHGRRRQTVVDRVKLAQTLVLMRERLHDALAIQLLVNQGGLLPACL